MLIFFADNYRTDIPRNYPRIGYTNRVATITGTAGATYGPDVVGNPATYERWNPQGPSSITFRYPSLAILTYVGIAAHTLRFANINLYQSSDGQNFTRLMGGRVRDGRSQLLFVFNTIATRYLRITFSRAAEIGVIYTGDILEMPRGIYAGHAPVSLSRKTVKKVNKSIKGQHLGVSVVRTGLQSSYDFSHIPLDFYDLKLDLFAQAITRSPFFIAWNPLEHPLHVAFGYAQQDIAPRLNGTRNYCDFSVAMDCYSNEGL